MSSLGKRAELLTEEEDLSDEFMSALAHTFVRFSSQAKEQAKANGYRSDRSVPAAQTSWMDKLTLGEKELDAFAKAVNDGKTMSEAEKEEIRQYFDVDEEKNLTFNGFCEMYHLQTTSSPDETWNDLHALGFDDSLRWRRPEHDEEVESAAREEAKDGDEA